MCVVSLDVGADFLTNNLDEFRALKGYCHISTIGSGAESLLKVSDALLLYQTAHSFDILLQTNVLRVPFHFSVSSAYQLRLCCVKAAFL